MKHLKRFLAAGLALAALAGVGGAQASGGAGEAGGAGAAIGEPDDVQKPRAKARLIAEHTGLVPGTTAHLGLTFDIDQGWHLYWDGASDTGMPIQVAPSLPRGFEAGALLWPAPKRHVVPGDMLDYIYEGRVTLLLPVAVPADAKPGERVRISARLDWLECKDICLPGEAEVELTLPIAAPGQTPPKSADAPRFEEARGRLPAPLPASEPGVGLAWSGPQLTIRVPGASALAFYPKTGPAVMVDPIREGATRGDTLSIGFEGRGGAGAEGENRITGVLEVTHADGRTPSIYAIDTPGPSTR